MSKDEKMNADLPPYMVTLPAATEKQRSTKKYAILAVSGILTTIFVLSSILTGIHLFYSAQKEMLQFSLNVDKNTRQDVRSDSSNSVVQHYIHNADYDLWVLNDFNRDIQTLKVKDKTSTACYVGPLNRTLSDVGHDQSGEAQNAVKYRTSDTTIPDNSFLSRTASGFCNGVPTYWMFPQCSAENGSSNQSKDRLCPNKCVCWCCKSYLGRCTKMCCICRETIC